jgi:hypothetical protein
MNNSKVMFVLTMLLSFSTAVKAEGLTKFAGNIIFINDSKSRAAKIEVGQIEEGRSAGHLGGMMLSPGSILFYSAPPAIGNKYQTVVSIQPETTLSDTIGKGPGKYSINQYPAGYEYLIFRVAETQPSYIGVGAGYEVKVIAVSPGRGTKEFIERGGKKFWEDMSISPVFEFDIREKMEKLKKDTDTLNRIETALEKMKKMGDYYKINDAWRKSGLCKEFGIDSIGKVMLDLMAITGKFNLDYEGILFGKVGFGKLFGGIPLEL